MGMIIEGGHYGKTSGSGSGLGPSDIIQNSDAAINRIAAGIRGNDLGTVTMSNVNDFINTHK